MGKRLSFGNPGQPFCGIAEAELSLAVGLEFADVSAIKPNGCRHQN
jgi:hypothetical protein